MTQVKPSKKSIYVHKAFGFNDPIPGWGFHAHLDTQSTLTWTLIPRPLGH